MSNPKSALDCMRQCRLHKHGDAINSAITKRSVCDEALASYMRCTCANFAQALDNEGRTAIHMAASRGRQSLVEWLVKMASENSINIRDRESGYTALHRSIFYGQIHMAVALMKKGINVDILDKDGYKAIDHAMLDRSKVYKYDAEQPCDVYVWGSNANYTLGTVTQNQKNSPDILNCFSRQRAPIKQVHLGKFHSVWLDSAGAVWGCGQAWRLGAGEAVGTLVRPTRLHGVESCVQAALTLDSTVLLLQSGSVVQYGLNESDDNSRNQSSNNKCNLVKLSNVKHMVRLLGALGLCASRHHCVVWTDLEVLTWGVNVGQLGHSQDKIVNMPKKVLTINSHDENTIKLAAACDSATVVYTSRGFVYLLHQYLCKKIITKQKNLKQIVVEGKVKEHSAPNITVLLLTNLGDIMMWQHQTNQLTRCVFSVSHNITATHLALINETILFTTQHGEGFVGSFTGNKIAAVKVDKRGGIQKPDMAIVKLRRLSNVHRAVVLTADLEGNNYAVLQVRPTWGLTGYPKLTPSTISEDMSVFLSECSTEDMLHDFVFKVGNRLFPVHTYPIANGSAYLYKLYQNALSLGYTYKPIVTIEEIDADVFERVLEYLYTGSCDVVRPGTCLLRVRKEEYAGTTVGEEDKAKHQDNLKIMTEDIMTDDILTEDVSKQSAFGVYKMRKKERDRKMPKVKRSFPFLDPIKLMRAAAEQLQLNALDQLLTHFYYEDGDIHKRDTWSKTKSEWSLRRTECSDLADATVQGDSGAPLLTHKCVLAARSEYFNGMFMHSWTENKSKSVVKLPIKENILRPVVEFLYSDTCHELETSENVDFVCSLLIVADQLFISRLRQMCEVTLAGLVTLKNCTEMCEFADTYNAPQLKEYCMKYISMNLCVLLENKSLEFLSENILNELTQFYCNFYPIMSSRVVTPFSCAVDDDTVTSCAERFPVDLNKVDTEYLKENKTVSSGNKNKSKKVEFTTSEKARMRYESVSSVNSIDLTTENSAGDISLSLNKLQIAEENTKKEEKWIEVQSPQDKQQKIVQARLRVVCEAKNTILESPAENFTTLSKSFGPNSPTKVTTHTVISPVPLSCKDAWLRDGVEDHNRSPRGSIYINYVGSTKLSQKQRKKLSMEQKDNGFNSTPSSSDIPAEVVSTSPKSKNPWKTLETSAVQESTAKETAVSFTAISANQRKQREQLCRMMTKPLLLTQLEDKAIYELEKFYNTQEMDEECISVYRIDRNIQLSPQWIHGNHSVK